MFILFIFFFKQKTAYEMRISDWSSDVCSSDLGGAPANLACPKVEAVMKGRRDPDRIAAGGVQHPLGIAGRAGGVEDELLVFSAHWHAGACRTDIGRQRSLTIVAHILYHHLDAGLDYDRPPLTFHLFPHSL